MINLADIKSSKAKFDNRYYLIEKIGGGGFSEVWLAHDTNANIDVALKIYTPNGELDDEGKDDFRREFARLCGLNHSNIIHAIGFGIHNDELPYLAMNVCKNGSAKKLIGHYDENQLWILLEQVALGLQYLHSHDITHQDIKPDNILINSDGQYLIIDFGISTKTRSTLRRTDKGTVAGGTPWYMSNESFKSDSSDIHARDIWALGASLYEIITGDVPFGQYGGLTQQAQKGKIPPINADVSEELKQLVYDCLALEAWDRPDANAILERIKQHKEGVTVHTKGYNKMLFGVASVVLIALGCYVMFAYVLPSDGNSEEKTEQQLVYNRNDSAFLAKIYEATSKAKPEFLKKRSEVDEDVLCSAAKTYAEAKTFEVSDIARTKGDSIWSATQNLIDSTYDYLYQQSFMYHSMDAEEASSRFAKRYSKLADYVTPSRVKNTPQNDNVRPTPKKHGVPDPVGRRSNIKETHQLTESPMEISHQVTESPMSINQSK